MSYREKAKLRHEREKRNRDDLRTTKFDRQNTMTDEDEAEDSEQNVKHGFSLEVMEDLAGTDYDLAKMNVAAIRGTEYRVVSTHGNLVHAYKVDIDAMTCNCEDKQYNKTEKQEACKHLIAAIVNATDSFNQAEWVGRDLVQMRDNAQHLQRELKDAVDWVSTVIDSEAAASASAKAADGDAVEKPDGSGTAEAPDADEKAGKLQAAFDGIIDDMQVEATAEHVWFQTGQDTPDAWPHPGGEETFKVLTSPDMVTYVHDGSADWADSPHKLYDKKPGEWFKNAIHVNDVDDYIEKTL